MMELKQIYEKIKPTLDQKGYKAQIGSFYERERVIKWKGESNGSKGTFLIFLVNYRNAYKYWFEFVGHCCGWSLPSHTIDRLYKCITKELGVDEFVKAEKTADKHEQMSLF